jgi:hypothetical protein
MKQRQEEYSPSARKTQALPAEVAQTDDDFRF